MQNAQAVLGCAWGLRRDVVPLQRLPAVCAPGFLIYRFVLVVWVCMPPAAIFQAPPSTMSPFLGGARHLLCPQTRPAIHPRCDDYISVLRAGAQIPERSLALASLQTLTHLLASNTPGLERHYYQEAPRGGRWVSLPMKEPWFGNQEIPLNLCRELLVVLLSNATRGPVKISRRYPLSLSRELPVVLHVCRPTLDPQCS